MTKQNVISSIGSSAMNIAFAIRNAIWPEWVETIDDLTWRLTDRPGAHVTIALKRMRQGSTDIESAGQPLLTVHYHYFVAKAWFDDRREREIAWAEYIGNGIPVFADGPDGRADRFLSSEKEARDHVNDIAQRIKRATGIEPTIVMPFDLFADMDSKN